MAIEAIGGVTGGGATNPLERTGVASEDFIRLFLTQLSFQDPLEPVDNREFLAQLAQFTVVQQLQTLNDNVSALLTFSSSSQAINLLNRTVEIATGTADATVGQVTTVNFESGSPLLNIMREDGTFLQDVGLASITLVR
jgi:flagellar basal-body rod modification protein FlgD